MATYAPGTQFKIIECHHNGNSYFKLKEISQF